MPSVLPLKETKASHEMLLGFRDGIREGTYHGKHLVHIAQGLMFLDMMIGQSQGQLERAIQAEKEMRAKAKEAIQHAQGTVNAQNNPA